MAQQGELNVGELVRERYGAKSFLIGFSTYSGTVTDRKLRLPTRVLGSQYSAPDVPTRFHSARSARFMRSPGRHFFSLSVLAILDSRSTPAAAG
jgi:hypothetical protein